MNISTIESENTKSGVFMSLVFYFKKTFLSDFWTCLPKVGHIVDLLYETSRTFLSVLPQFSMLMKVPKNNCCHSFGPV